MELYVTLEEVKKSIPGYVDYGKDDDRLTRLIKAAQSNLEKRLQRALTDKDCLSNEGKLDEALRTAIIVKVATLYDTTSEISYARPYNTGIVEDLITPFIKFRGGSAV